ncbi:suppressor of fused domain protein [Gorillibacterium sp. CAU 1737]|uniref:suppressor of fused domain protein n=1 Tax=Gorillibacterium sp. CAU 1737 TaxID=3140362 RepID=UPI0032602420
MAEPLQEPKILIESWSPVSEIQAFVEETEECVYFYLWAFPGREDATVRSCWVCNKQAAPAAPDFEAMQQGRPPMMPAAYCDHPDGRKPPEPDTLEIVWFKEGDAAALLENGSLLAVIPGWSGEGGFHGYALFSNEAGPFAWPLKEAEPVLVERVERSRRFWETFTPERWGQAQQQYLAVLESFLGGPHEKYYAIDGGHFPPKAMITAHKEEVLYAFTLGVSLIPQPKVEQYLGEEGDDSRRIELAFAARIGALADEKPVLGYLSAQTGLPWGLLTWLGHGHTLSCAEVPGFPYVLLLNGTLAVGTPSPELPELDGERVNVLWAIPITEAEYQVATEQGSEELLRLYKGEAEQLAIFTGEPKFIRS